MSQELETAEILSSIRSMKKELRTRLEVATRNVARAVHGSTGMHSSVHYAVDYRNRLLRELERYESMEARYKVQECSYCQQHGSGACVACGCDSDHVCFHNTPMEVV